MIPYSERRQVNGGQRRRRKKKVCLRRSRRREVGAAGGKSLETDITPPFPPSFHQAGEKLSKVYKAVAWLCDSPTPYS